MQTGLNEAFFLYYFDCFLIKMMSEIAQCAPLHGLKTQISEKIFFNRGKMIAPYSHLETVTTNPNRPAPPPSPLTDLSFWRVMYWRLWAPF